MNGSPVGTACNGSELEGAGYSTRVVNSVSEIPSGYPRPAADSPDAVFFELAFLQAVEVAMGASMKMRYVLVLGPDETVVALGVLTTLRIDGLSLAPKGFRRCLNVARRVIPNLLRYRVTCCGFPFWGATSPVAMCPAADRTAVDRCLIEVLVAQARAERSRVVLLHDFDSDSEIFDSLLLDSPVALHSAPSLPDHLFPPSFANLDEYFGALRPEFARPLQDATAAFDKSPLEIRHFPGGPEVAEWITPEVHALHETMASSGNMHFSFLTRELLLSLSNACPDRTVWTLVFDQKKVVGYVFGLITDSSYYSMYLGHEPSYNESAELYTNLVLRNAEHAMLRGVREIRLGTEVRLGSEYIDFKARLGCVQRSRRFWVGSPRLLVSTGIRITAPLIFQPPEAPRKYRVFEN